MKSAKTVTDVQRQPRLMSVARNAVCIRLRISGKRKSQSCYHRKTDAESNKDKDYGIDEWIAHTLSPCPYRTIAMVPA